MAKGGRASAVIAILGLLVGLLHPPVEAARLTIDVPVAGFDATRAQGVTLRPGLRGTAEVPTDTHAIGLRWTGAASVSIRSLGPAGWSAWTPVEGEADHGPDGDATPVNIAGPIWTGVATTAVDVVAAGGPLGDLVVFATGDEDLIDPADVLGPTPDRGPAIVPATAWRSPGWSWENCPEGLEVTRPVEAVIVHHTATTTEYRPADVGRILRSIHRFHTATRGWCDIAYQFLIDRFGRIWEGRVGGTLFPIEGGHARGFNRATTGVAVIGDFDRTDLPHGAVDALSLLAAWKATANDFDPRGSVHRVSGGSSSLRRGTEIEMPRVAGHRDVSATSCPGVHADAWLDEIRELAAARLRAPEPFRFGQRGDVPLIGDWDGNGILGAGVFTAGVFQLRSTMSGGAADRVVRFGLPGDHPVVGDWNGDGTDTVGVERDGTFHLLTANRTPDPLGALSGDRTVRPDVPADFDLHNAVPLSGDWDGDGIDTLGLASRGHVVLFADADAQQVLRRDWLGNPGAAAVVGDWNGDGVDELGAIGGGSLWVRTPLGDDFVAMHAMAGAVRVSAIDWSRLGLPTLLTVTPDLAWDPTTPIGL